jgi:hypothetical protein
MEDFDALAAALGAGIADLRGCLILSRDGLVLGGHPDTAEPELKDSWLRFAALGEPERGFVQFGNEIWSYARRGPYGSFAVTGIGVRPGLVIDHIERALQAAEDARSKREGPRVAMAPAPPAQASRPTASSGKRKKRRSLHGDPAPTEERALTHTEPAPTRAEPVSTHAEPDAIHIGSEAWPTASDGGDGPLEDVGETHPGAGPSAGKREEPAETEPVVGLGDPDDEDEIDRFSLAAEFSRLLQDKRGDADG